MSARIEPTIIITDGARVVADGHFKIRIPPTVGPVVSVTVTLGTYTRLSDLCTQIAADMVAALGAGWSCSAGAGGDEVRFTGPAAFDIEFYDAELAAHLGYQMGVIYAGLSVYLSDIQPRGRITLGNPLDFTWGIRLPRRASVNHRGMVSASLLPGKGVAVYTGLVMDTEVSHFAQVLVPILSGLPFRIWLDRTVVADWGLTVSNWKGGRLVVLANPGAEHDLTQFLNPPATTVRRVALRVYDVEV